MTYWKREKNNLSISGSQPGLRVPLGVHEKSQGASKIQVFMKF